jgi:hypothetical protein
MPEKEKPMTHREAVYGPKGESDMMSLAIKLHDCFWQEEGTTGYREGLELLNSDVLELLIDDLEYGSQTTKLAELANAIKKVTTLEVENFLPGRKPNKNSVALKVKIEQEEGLLGAITNKELAERLRRAGCVDTDPSNAGKLAKKMGIEISGGKPGPKPKKPR